ncbi:UNVERIFIED_CONTAM: hypothetical protein Sindi_2635000 [Sesamum indicum]
MEPSTSEIFGRCSQHFKDLAIETVLQICKDKVLCFIALLSQWPNILGMTSYLADSIPPHQGSSHTNSIAIPNRKESQLEDHLHTFVLGRGIYLA